MQFELQHGVSIKQQGVSLELEELLLKFIWKNKEPRISKMIFKTMKKGRVILPQMVINSTWCCEGIDKKTSGGKKQAPTNMLVYIYRMTSYDRVGI